MSAAVSSASDQWFPALIGRKVEAVRAVVESGADVHAVTRLGMPLEVAVRAGMPEVVDLLLAAGADPNRYSNDRAWYLLHAAAHDGQGDLIEKMTTAGADPNVRNDALATPLMVAVIASSTYATAALLKAGADPNLGNKDDSTPLHHAAAMQFSQMVDMLLAAGANPGAVDRFGKTPLDRMLELVADPAAPLSPERAYITNQLRTAGHQFALAAAIAPGARAGAPRI